MSWEFSGPQVAILTNHPLGTLKTSETVTKARDLSWDYQVLNRS